VAQQGDAAAALAHYRKSCELRSGDACNNLGARQAGDGDFAAAVASYRRGCALGSAIACTNLGTSLQLGRAGAKDPARAASLFTRSCDAGEPTACNNLAATLVSSDEDKPRAAALLKRSCDGGSALGCAGLGRAYEAGAGVTRNDAIAARLADTACSAGELDACLRQATYELQGQGVPRDPAAARARACRRAARRAQAQLSGHRRAVEGARSLAAAPRLCGEDRLRA
jgi:TPR repeat protein